VHAYVHKDEYSYVYKYLRLYYVSKKRNCSSGCGIFGELQTPSDM
jgi:hypothetical protein